MKFQKPYIVIKIRAVFMSQKLNTTLYRCLREMEV